MKKPKILIYDIETSPNLGYTWGKYDQTVLGFVKDRQLLSVAWKWHGERKVHCKTVVDVGGKDDLELCKLIRKLHQEADILVAHNGNNFDHKVVRSRLLVHGLAPTKPQCSVDTRQVAARHFQFASNSLDELGRVLGLGRKREAGGFGLWVDCMANKAAAWRKMKKYNIQDVVLLDKVYNKLKPWMKDHPSLALFDGRPGCPSCGSAKVQKRGIRVTLAQRKQAYQCRACGAWFEKGSAK